MNNKYEKNKIDGLIVLDKPKDFTSNDCLQVIKHVLNIDKIGHTGTLDTNATGVLLCLLGKATKCQDYLMSYGDKVYDAELILGFSTDTEDITGVNDDGYKIIEDSIIVAPDGKYAVVDKKRIEKEEIEKTLKSFIGNYAQVPPMYSAKKVNGAKLINLARKGKEVERRANDVKIYDIELIALREFTCIAKNVSIDKKDIMIALTSVDIKVKCCKGTYIRTLCKDIGEKLGANACMGNLRRIKTSDFTIEDSITIENIKEKVKNGDLSFVKPCLYQKYDSVVTFGKFETLHIGHQKIIKKVVDIAKEKSLESTVLLVGKSKDIKFLSDAQRISKLDYLGVDNVIEFPFNDWTKKMDAISFVKDILIKQLKAKFIVVGSDCSFGAGASGNAKLLKDISNALGVEVLIVDKMKVENTDIDISSTLINKEYNNKNFELVDKLLGKGN